MVDLIIIGLGPAGINASIYAKRSNLNVLVFEKKMPGGSLPNIKIVENYLGYEQISGADLAMNFYKQFKALKVPMISEEVIDIKDNGKTKMVITKEKTYETKAVIIATGRGPLKLNLKNEDLPGVGYCVLCDGSLYRNKVVALYGNKPEVLEDAIYLSSIVSKLYLIVNSNRLLGNNELVNKVNSLENIEIKFNNTIKNINGINKLDSINLEKEEIKIDGLFINNEYGPLTSFCKELNILDNKGYIIVNGNCETIIPGIYGCGDSIKKDVYQIITSASEGATAAINAYKYIKHLEN